MTDQMPPQPECMGYFPIQCTDMTDLGGSCFIAQIDLADDFEMTIAKTAVSAQLELLGRLGAQ